MKIEQDNNKLSIELILSPLKVVPEIDKFSMWMLAGVGTTAALLVSNLDSIVNVTSAGSLSWIFALLAVSGLFGFLSKLCGIRAQTALSVIRHIEAALNDNRNADVGSALQEYFSIFPFWIRVFVERASKKGTEDPLLGYRVLARLAVYQGVWAICQGLTFILFIVVAALGLN